MNNQCDFPRCRNPASYGYIGREICVEHWAQICNANPRLEKELLKKIGLIRNKSGAVVPITPV